MGAGMVAVVTGLVGAAVPVVAATSEVVQAAASPAMVGRRGV